MKKYFYFAIALVVCALACTSCNQKIDSPLVGWWSASTYVVDETTHQERAARNDLNFIDNGQFQQNLYYQGTFDGLYAMGTWAVNGNKVTISKTSSGTINNNNFVNDYTFKPYTEEYTWRIEGHYLYLKTADGEEYQFRDGKP
jgi:hypothetical protein